MASTLNRIKTLDTAITGLADFHEKYLRHTKRSDPPSPSLLFTNIIGELKADKRLSDIVAKHELPWHLLEKLMDGMQNYTGRVNEIFNRNFAHHPSVVFSVDPVACGPSGGVLTHERKIPSKPRAITGGGLVDGNETALEAAYREFDEETGKVDGKKKNEKDCKLTECTLAIVVDGVRSDGPYFLTCGYHAKYSGTPILNLEADNFKEILPEKISEYTWFIDHASLVKNVLELKQGTASYPIKGIPYSSAQETFFPSHKASKVFKPILKDESDVVYVENAIERITKIYADLTKILEAEFIPQIDKAALDDSCTEIGHGWQKKIVDITPEMVALRKNWNDNKRLWDFLGPIKSTAIEISSLFDTFINTGEGGIIGMAPLYMAGDQVYLKEDVFGQLSLHRGILTQFRNFKDSLHHHALENGVELKPTNLPILTNLYEDPSCTYTPEVRARIFGFVIDIAEEKNIPTGTSAYSLAELKGLPQTAWESEHDYKIFQEISSSLAKL